MKDVFKFGYIEVPEQHALPNGPTIRIAVAIFEGRKDSSNSIPLVMNAGGPGDSNLDAFIPLLAGPMGNALLEKGDVVLIELRGLRHLLLWHILFLS